MKIQLKKKRLSKKSKRNATRVSVYMIIELTGEFIKIEDYNRIATIKVDINYLYKTLKEKGYYLLDPYDSRNPLNVIEVGQREQRSNLP